MATPFLKWAGGKGKLARHILARMPAGVACYHEPFAGGGAVFFALQTAGRVTDARLSDSNVELIECFVAVRDRPLELVSALAELAHQYDRRGVEGRLAYFLAHRSAVPLDPLARAARMIFLNKTCYNGLFRVNRRGEFNVPHGRYAHPRICDPQTIMESSRALTGVGLSTDDFAAASGNANPGDFVYFDPPYQPLTATARFTSYTRAEFGLSEQTRLRDCFEALTERGVAAMLSNSDHPQVHELYDGRGYGFEHVEMSRAINSVGSKRAPVAELLIDNFARAGV